LNAPAGGDLDVSAAAVTVSVLDCGPGVPEQELQSICEPFFRYADTAQNSEGYGLGLTIAQRVIDAHGGKIRVYNRVGGGLCVEISLPAMSESSS